MDIYMFRDAFSLCNFSNKAVEMQTMKNARQFKCHKIILWSDFKEIKFYRKLEMCLIL